MKRIIFVLVIITLYNTAYSQEYFLGIETGYGISSSRIEVGWYGSTITALAENCGKAGVTGKMIFENNLGVCAGLHYLFIQTPDKWQNSGYSPTPGYNDPLYLINKHHYLNLPISLSYSIKYFRLEAGLYYSFLIAQNANVSARTSDVGALFKLNFNLYKGLYFYQETSFGLINTVDVNNLTKKNYYLMLGLGYNLNLEN